MVRAVPASSAVLLAARFAAAMAGLLVAACASKDGDGASPLADTVPPTVPAGLTATPTSVTSVALAWSAASDAVGVTGYEVLRDGVLVKATPGTAWSDTGLAPLTAYCWAVRALDAAGNRSGNSADACATTPVLDLAPPTVVETTPTAGATDLAPTAVFTARFDEAVAPATLAGGGFALGDAGSATVPAAVTWDAPTLTATLTPSAPLANLGSYTAVVSTAVTDLAGNHLLAEVRWTVRVAVKALVFRRAAGGSLGALSCAPPRLAAADFDQDGHVDLALTCPYTVDATEVWVARGDGAGGFALPSTFPVGAAGSFLTGLAAADLDGDGYPDLAVAEGACTLTTCLVNGYVDVILNGGAASPGSFGSPLRLGAGMYPMDVVAADLDGDGNVDLASVELWSNRLSVFLANGGGDFAPAVTYDAADPTTLVAVALRPGGPIDLVPTGGPVLLGDGHGGFTPGTGAFAPGLYPMDVAAGDLDRDGNVDLVVPNDATDHVTVLGGNGSGAFPPQATRTVPTGAIPGAVQVADLNGDGWPDVLVVLHANGSTGTNASVVLLGTGGGGFDPPVLLDGQPFAVLDLNGDGKPDLVGTRLNENPWGFVLDVWLNATP